MLRNFTARKVTAIVGATPTIADWFRHLNPRTALVHNFPIAEEIRSTPPEAWEDRRFDRSLPRQHIPGTRRLRMLEALSNLERVGHCRLALAGWFSPVTLKQEIEKSPGPVAWIPRQIVPRRAHGASCPSACRNRGASS